MFSKKNLYLNEKTFLAVVVPASQGAKDGLRRRSCLFLAFCLLLLPLSVAQAQVTEEWVARYNGPGNSGDSAKALAVDDSGNVCVTGYSKGSVTDFDYATIKYDKDGKQLWVARYNGPGNGRDEASALAVDSMGNVYVTGRDDGIGTEDDYATIKYDKDGKQLWVARYNGPGNHYDHASALALDDSGNVYVTGYSEGIGTDVDYATIKYDNNGNEIWVARYDGSGNGKDGVSALALDDFGNVYVTGHSLGIGTGNDYATVKYDNNGNEIWVVRYNGPGNGRDDGNALAVDDSGNIYVTGVSEGKGTNSDYATIKYDKDGKQIWIAIYDGSVDDDNAFSVAVDLSGNVYATGESKGVDLDYATIKYSQQLTLVCKTDKPVYNPWERVQVLADVDNPGSSFTANLVGGLIVLRPLPKKPLILTGDVITRTIDPGLNSNIPLHISLPVITGLIAPEGTHGAFGVLYKEHKILAIDTCTWGLKGPPLAVQKKFFSDFIRSYIKRYGIEKLQNANAKDIWAAPVSGVPLKNSLGKAFPNVANPETWFPFQLSEPSEVIIQIHNASGQLVKTLNLGYKQAGHYLNKERAAFWNGRNDRGERVASGIYFYTMCAKPSRESGQTKNFIATGKVVILK